MSVKVKLKKLSLFTHTHVVPNPEEILHLREITEKLKLLFTDDDYIYIYAFSRRFYPKRLTVHSGYTCFFFLITMCVPWESNPQPFALPTQCSTTEPQEHIPVAQ